MFHEIPFSKDKVKYVLKKTPPDVEGGVEY